MDDMLRDLARLRHYASGMQQLFEELQLAAPERSEGTDRSGTIHAVLGRDGLPIQFRVRSWWRERLTPESFGAAVTEACQEAVKDRGALWAQQLRESGWQQRLDRLEDDSAQTPQADPDPVPPAFRRPASSTQPRPLGVLAEEAIDLLDVVTRQAATPQPQRAGGSGANQHGTLTVTVSPGGQASCQADPRWVSQRSGAQLSQALNEVLTKARRNLTASPSAATDFPTGEADRHERLMTEISAALYDAARDK